MWRNRIVRHGEEDPTQLLANPHNWRVHPKYQQDVLGGVLREVGWIAEVTVNQRTGYVIDGHLRVAMAISKGMATVPVKYVDLSEEEEALVIATFDPISALAVADAQVLEELLEQASTEDEAIQKLLDEITAEAGATIVRLFPENSIELILTRHDVPDALWPTDNEWGIPTLDLHWQADAVDLPVTAWGTPARSRKMKGTWHFYTEDYRFRALWDDPTPVINSRCVNVVEPNFTTSEQMAKAAALYRIYQKRWLARYWQSQGIRVFVDLNVSPGVYDLNLLGVPEGWRAWATRGYTDRMEDTLAEYEIACLRAGTDDILFLVIGGGRQVEALCGERGWVWIPEQRTVARAQGWEAVKDG